MVGYDDPFIPAVKRDAWIKELNLATNGTDNTAEVQVWMNEVHAFSIQYSPTFIGVLGATYKPGQYGDGVYPGSVRYSKSTAEKSFDKIDYLFHKYGLISKRSFPANPVLPAPRASFGEKA